MYSDDSSIPLYANILSGMVKNISLKIEKLLNWANKMAQKIKVPATKSDNLYSVIRTHIVKAENRLHKLSSVLHKHTTTRNTQRM